MASEIGKIDNLIRLKEADIAALKRARELLIEAGDSATAQTERRVRSLADVYRVRGNAQNIGGHAARVMAVIKSAPEREWRTADVESALRKQGNPIETKRPRSTISRALKQLTDEGLIEVTFEGGGRIGNRYRVVPPEKEEEQEIVISCSS